MAFLNNHCLALEALASMGCIIPTEHRAAIDTSLAIKREEAGLSYLGFWGRVTTQTGKDYLIAQGCNSIEVSPEAFVVPEIKSYYSLDGSRWLDLEQLTDEAFDACKTIQGGFKGDPSHKYKAVVKAPPPPAPAAKPTAADGEPAPSPDAPTVEEVVDKPPEAEVTTDNPEEGGEGGEGGEQKKKLKLEPGMRIVEYGELDRLSAFIRAVDHDCGVMPLGVLVLNHKKQLVPNTLFTGLKFPEKLDSYCHIFQRYDDSILTKDTTGCWSLQAAPITNNVVLKCLWWPGYFFYYHPFTKSFGSLYFGLGDKNLDFGFMVG